MQFDVFFSLSHTPVDGKRPTEAQMFHNFFEQVEAGVVHEETASALLAARHQFYALWV